jgi:hypothetical protein
MVELTKEEQKLLFGIAQDEIPPVEVMIADGIEPCNTTVRSNAVHGIPCPSIHQKSLPHPAS